MEGWKLIGQLQAVVLHLAEVCKKFGIDAVAILEWMVGEGREVMEKEFWTPLVERFKQTLLVEVVDNMTIRVNLNVPPQLPFTGAVVHNKPKGTGWVEVKRVGDDLFVDGKKIVLTLSKRQKGMNTIPGMELLDELKRNPVLHPNIMDALCEYRHLIPESWKRNTDGETLFIYFWDVVFRGADGDFVVRCFFWDDGAWDRYYSYVLGFGWHRQRPAAELAS